MYNNAFSRLHFLPFIVVMLMSCLLVRTSNAVEMKGFYLGGAVGSQYTDVTYEKSVSVDVPSPSFAAAEDGSQTGVNLFKVLIGHRWNLTDRVYLSGEIDAAVGLDNRIKGFLEEGTGVDNRDVWPGTWYLEENFSFGFNAKLGYLPGEVDILGRGGSLYLLAGIQWLDLTVEDAFQNSVRNISDRLNEDLSAVPWLVGAGVEFGTEKNRIDLQVSYISYEVDFGSGDGVLDTSPRLNHEFAVQKWGISLGYNWYFRVD